MRTLMVKACRWVLCALLAGVGATHSTAAAPSEDWQQVVVGKEFAPAPDQGVEDRPWWQLLPDTRTNGFWLFRTWYRSGTEWVGVLYDAEGKPIVGPMALPTEAQRESRGAWGPKAVTVDALGNIHAAYVRASDVEAFYSAPEGSRAQPLHRLVACDRSGRMISLVDVRGAPDPPRFIMGMVVLPDGSRALSWEREFAREAWLELQCPDGEVRWRIRPYMSWRGGMSVDWRTGRLLVQHPAARDDRALIVAYDIGTGKRAAGHQLRPQGGLLGSDHKGRLYTIGGAGLDRPTECWVRSFDADGRPLRWAPLPALTTSRETCWSFAVSARGDAFAWDVIAQGDVVVWRLPAGRLIEARGKERLEPMQKGGAAGR